MDAFCSTIIPTINRSTLSRAVYSVLDQAFTGADFEVIVVNDSGQPLPDMDWQHSERVRVITTQRRERSVARNTGAAIARGKYLHFLPNRRQ
jgi:glycosyltransferase involved in cell wall biosynthesis